MSDALIHITGIVQGVGMRPFVYREAVANRISGWVLNAGDGVHIEAHGTDEDMRSFIHGLSHHAPAASRVEQVLVTPLEATQGDGESIGPAAAPDTAPTAGTAHAAGDNAAHAAGAATATASTAFLIRASEDETAHTTLVSPDIATCPDCARELFDPRDRRYHYPFINCTNCGPRFTIIRDLPYDRAKTSMASFPMCPTCANEYADPLDRRFHAQPDACFDCGPHITWRERPLAAAQEPAADDDPAKAAPTPAVGFTRRESDAIIQRCVELLARGGVVAIKGLGGFHLACDAGNQNAVAELRRRKRRSSKPLAVMVRDIDRARGLCHVDEDERQLLAGSVRPIVLLRRRTAAPLAASGSAAAQPAVAQPAATQPAAAQPATPQPAAPQPAAAHLAPAVAFDLPELGVMLPYTPLQHLLMAECERMGITALVMTSGNVSEEPIETDDRLAWSHLVASGIADALLGNDRDILSRYDDSVVRVVDGTVMPVRRARGYAPQPLPLPKAPAAATAHSSSDIAPAAAAPFNTCILACGSEQKATLALTREAGDGGASCFLSQHIGDIENAETFDAWHAARERLTGLFDLHPTAIACDLHPTYLSSQWARRQAELAAMPLIEVQHHHAHVASVLAQHPAVERALGLAFDGTGAGTDGTIWGGELLLASLAGYSRVGSLAPWRLPGGPASVRDPRRNALALLYACNLLDHPGAAKLLGRLDQTTRDITLQMAERGINSPLTSSMGRLFDAASALLGICDAATYEGEPAILLEAAAWRALEAGDGAAASNLELPAFTLSWVAPGDPDPQTRSRMARVDEEPARERLVLDPSSTIKGLLDAAHSGIPADTAALALHRAVAASACMAARDACRRTGVDTVALSGGVFINRLLLRLVRESLERGGLTVLVPQSVPVNDGCIAYGQAAVTRRRLGPQWE